MTNSIKSLVAYCRENKRVCPMPSLWNELWKMLPNRTRVGNGWQPALPLILAAWHDTPALLKTLRLTEHIEWAAQHGALEMVARFLRELREEDWHHVGE
jgi:hypothetical protein